MKTYRVDYKETVFHTFYVEANSEEEAHKVFRRGMMDGAFDFSDGVAEETDYNIVEDDDIYHFHYAVDDEDEPDWDDEDYIPSAERGDYSPSNPWDAPGMRISDFI